METKKSNYYLSQEDQRICFPPEAAAATSCFPVPKDVVPAVQIPVYFGVPPLQYSFSFLATTLSSPCDAFISCSLLDLTKCGRCPASDAFEVFVVMKCLL